MAIDTESKRKSVINNGLPGLALLPIPDALIQAIDRRRLADFYSLGSQVISRNFWVPDRRETSSLSNFAQDRRASTDWKQDQDSPGDWREESEVSIE